MKGIDPVFWKDKKVFITGVTGFKGSWLAIWLVSLGAKVYGYALDPPTVPSLFVLSSLEDKIKFSKGDIRNLKTLRQSVTECQPDIVFHLAAQPIVRQSYEEPILTYETNVIGTAKLLEAIRGCNSVKAVVLITTDKCYDNKEWVWGYREIDPLGGYDPYSSSKACAELVISAYRSSFFNPEEYGKKHHIAIASARAGNVIGGGDWAQDRIVPDTVKALLEGDPVTVRNPNAIRPWQHVLEPLSGYMMLAEKLYTVGPEYGEAWNFGPNSSDERSVEYLVKTLCAQWPDAEAQYRIESRPADLHEAAYLKLDCSKARQELGWQPVWNLERALKATVDWYARFLGKRNMYESCIEQLAEYEEDARKKDERHV